MTPILETLYLSLAALLAGTAASRVGAMLADSTPDELAEHPLPEARLPGSHWELLP